MGKLAVPDAILNKPGKLTDEEFAVIRRHPGWGRRAAHRARRLLRRSSCGSSRATTNASTASGYPQPPRAGELELEVRILTVADVYDALTADRVYRPAWPPGQAFELLDSYAGNAFDRGCVEALHDVLSPAFASGMARAKPRGAPAQPPRRPRRGPFE